jgi:quinolinate synthase
VWQNKLIAEINRLKKKSEAIILVHNYQRPEIYEVADFVGDSFELAKKASSLKNVKRIVFCGVDFMAESTAILNPDKEVYLPAQGARCPMAAMVDVASLNKLQAQFPKAVTVCYVNTNAEIKALSDVCCTSSNAVKIVKSLPRKEIIFVPDKNLALYVASQVPEKRIIPLEGYCYVHQQFTARDVREAKQNYPHAKIIAHPECVLDVIKLADAVCSTSQMIDYAEKSEAGEFIVLTEVGMTERLKKEVSNKIFLTPPRICLHMKKNSLELIRDSLLFKQYLITVPDKVAEKARAALERMLEIA